MDAAAQERSPDGVVRGYAACATVRQIIPRPAHSQAQTVSRLPLDTRSLKWIRQTANSRLLATVLGVIGLTIALDARIGQITTHVYYDLKHFFEFAEAAFSPSHFDYYAAVANRAYTYAHLPLFPLLLAPFHRLALHVGWEPIVMVKGLVHAFEVATVVLIAVYGRRQGVPAVPAMLLGLAWLAAPWQFEASALNGHVTSVAAFFLLAAVLRRDIPWQAGALTALASTTRTEFLIAALALAGWYARRGLRPGLTYAAGGLGVGAVIVGPYLLRDAAALHWGVVGHLQGRGDGLLALHGILPPLTGGLPEALKGPQDWAMPTAVVLAAGVGWASRDQGLGLLRASLLYVLALTLGHGRYFVFPLTAGIVAAATPARWPWAAVVFLLEFAVPIPHGVRWIIRIFAIVALFAWNPLRAHWSRWSSKAPQPFETLKRN